MNKAIRTTAKMINSAITMVLGFILVVIGNRAALSRI